MTARARDDGFTTVELIVAGALALAVVGAVVSKLNVQISVSRVQTSAADLAQRARAAVELMTAEIAAAGGGVDVGPFAGGLGCCLPAVSPRRMGLTGADPPGTARPDAITVTYTPTGAIAARLESPLVGVAPALVLATAPPCPSGPLCGLADGDSVVVLDRVEYHDYFLVRAPTPLAATLTPRQPGSGHTFATGSVVVPIETHTYYFDPALRQLRHADGHASDVPAVDNVIGLSFSYLGESAAPAHPRPPTGVSNCLYDATGVRWPAVTGMSGDIGGLVELPLASFRDGPWCGAGENRFDLDLLRIRRVRVSVRLQAADDLRMASSLFARPGTSASPLRVVSDLSLAVDIFPRNLNAGR